MNTTIITFLFPFDGGHIVLATTEEWAFRYCSPQVLMACEAVGVVLNEPCPEDEDAASDYGDRELALLAEAQEQEWALPATRYVKGPADLPWHERWTGDCRTFEIDADEWADAADKRGLVCEDYNSNPLY